MSVDQIRKTFEAGFLAGINAAPYKLPEGIVKQELQRAWKKFCGIDT